MPSYIHIQWKGTDLCADVHCACGEMSHVDAESCYIIQCGYCKRYWSLSTEVILNEVSPLAIDADDYPIITQK